MRKISQINEAEEQPSVAPKARPKAISVKMEVKTVKLLKNDANIVKPIENIEKLKPRILK